jgi:hypothetical protein
VKKITQEIELFAWFRETLERAAGKALPELPGQILRSLRAPDELLVWVENVENGFYSVKQGVDHRQVPDLESRQRQVKRKSGQFYTPESFAHELLNVTQPEFSGPTLDPACGDGSFLLVAAQEMKKAAKDSFSLERIYGYDIDAQALLVCLARLLEKFWGHGWPKLRCANFLTSEVRERFVLILGNPPYKVNLNEELKKYLLKHFQTAEGEKDLYTFFIEKSTKLLENEGQLVLLTSHTYLVNHQCRLIREFICRYRLKNIFLLPPRFFVSAPGVLPAALHLQNAKALPHDSTLLHCSYVPGQGWQKSYSTWQETLASHQGLRQAIVPEGLKKTFAQMEGAFPQLGALCRVGVGIQESLKREGKISRFVADRRESERHKPVLKGRELAAMAIDWEGRYIDYGQHLAYAGDEKVFSGEKLLYQNIRNEKLKIRLVAAHDRDGFFPKNSLSFIVSNDSRLSLSYLEALLNSALLNAWFSGHFHSFHITVSQVKTIPVAIPKPELKRKIEELVDRIKAASDDSALLQELWQRLNAMVCEAYFGPGSYQQLLLDCDFFLEQAAAL